MKVMFFVIVAYIFASAPLSCEEDGGSPPSRIMAIHVANKGGFVNDQGLVVQRPQYDQCRGFRGEYGLVKLGSHWKFINRSFKLLDRDFTFIVPAPVSEDGVYCVKTQSGYRFYRPASDTFIGDSYRLAHPFSSGLGLAKDDEGWIALRSNSEVIFRTGLSVVNGFSEGFAAAKDGNIWGYLGGDGKMAIPPSFAKAEAFSDGLACIQAAAGKWGAIDRNGLIVLDCAFDDLGPFTDGLARFRAAHGAWGFVDRNGVVVIEPRYGSVLPFAGGLAPVMEKGRYGYIDRRGVAVIALSYSGAGQFALGLATVKEDPETTGGIEISSIIDRHGTKIFDGIRYWKEQMQP